MLDWLTVIPRLFRFESKQSSRDKQAEQHPAEQSKLNGEIKAFRICTVVSIGLGYKFYRIPSSESLSCFAGILPEPMLL